MQGAERRGNPRRVVWSVCPSGQIPNTCREPIETLERRHRPTSTGTAWAKRMRGGPLKGGPRRMVARPQKGKPHGSVPVACRHPGLLARVKAQELRLVWPYCGVRSVWYHAPEKRQVGSFRRKRRKTLPGRICSEGANPMSAAGVGGCPLGFAGSKPSRGYPNPEGGTKAARQTARPVDPRT